MEPAPELPLLLRRGAPPQARKLKEIIGEVRRQYERDLQDKETKKQQVGGRGGGEGQRRGSDGQRRGSDGARP